MAFVAYLMQGGRAAGKIRIAKFPGWNNYRDQWPRNPLPGSRLDVKEISSKRR